MQANQHGLYYPDVVANLFLALEDKIMKAIEVEETRVVGHASKLVGDYIEQKIHLHEVAKMDPANHGKTSFSPLIMSSRHHKGSLQLTWQELHFVPSKDGKTRRKKHVHIPKSANGTYSIPGLLKRAGYAEPIVEDYELRARELRNYWRQLMKVKRDIRHAMFRLPADIEALVEQIQATSLDRLIPRSQADFSEPTNAASV